MRLEILTLGRDVFRDVAHLAGVVPSLKMRSHYAMSVGRHVMPVFMRPDAEIHYEVHGSGFPLLLFAPGA